MKLQTIATTICARPWLALGQAAFEEGMCGVDLDQPLFQHERAGWTFAAANSQNPS